MVLDNIAIRSQLLLDYDTCQRFKAVSAILDESGKKRTLLDVGAGKGEFRFFLPPSWTYLSADIRASQFARHHSFVASGARLPFRDKCFDVVISIDALQYVQELPEFVTALKRISKDMVVVTCPVNNSQVRQAERELNALHVRLFGHGQVWLQRTFESGLPEQGGIVSCLGKGTVIIPNSYLPRWKIIQRVNIRLQRVGLLAIPLKLFVNAFLNILFRSIDTRVPSYRVIFVYRVGRDSAL